MSKTLLIAIDLVAIVVLTFGMYFPRHRRKAMVVAYLGANVGVLAVADALASSTVSAGLGLGLFGILSIIRLRSIELDQQEIAYYFAALALGLLAGIAVSPTWVTAALMGAILLALYIGDHPRLFSRHRSQRITLDAAYTDEAQIAAVAAELLAARVHRVTVRRVDLVGHTTTIDVRYELPRSKERLAEAHGSVPMETVGS